MKLLARLIKQSFSSALKSKRGSSYIEASIVMPLACIISIMMIQIAIVFFNDLLKQTTKHKEFFEEKSYSLQIELIRNYESIFQ